MADDDPDGTRPGAELPGQGHAGDVGHMTMTGRDPGDWESSLELATRAESAYWARRYTTVVLRSWCLCPQVIQAAESIVTELTASSSNAVNGADPAREPLAQAGPGGRVRLTLRLLASQVAIEVADHHPDSPVCGDADEDSESGRGLMIVGALSKEWGVVFPPSGGKVVRAILDVPA